MKTTHPPIKRMAYIDQQIRDNKYPNCSIAAKYFEVGRKTILRDIDFMRDQLGAPIEYDSGLNGYYYTEKNYRLPAINLMEGELFSLLIAEKVLRQYENTPYENDLRKIFNKIIAFLPDKVKINLDELGPDIFFKPVAISKIKKEIYDSISKAVKDEIEIEIVYYSIFNDEETERVIQPYYLINKYGDWYVFGFCKTREDFRLFSLQRIKSAKLLETSFFKEKIGDSKEIAGDSLDIPAGKGSYYCEIRVEYPDSYYVQERKWHSSQKIIVNKDRSIIISFTVNSLHEVKRWVLSLGANAKVIKPKLLKDEIKNEVKAISEKYKIKF